ncbi:hypothetical protein [Streptomyces sp. NBC_00887]|uniref:hypothetical protein n=1 Tax=Streptomyces sp. NBC_00887 TaxID=2975859 RepID=UPI003863A804|nr:hypothetical protein OG844_15205 [Streptomyces sp. NBC_00887]
MEQPEERTIAAIDLSAAFPSRLAGDVRSVSAVMPDATYSPADPFRVDVQGETVAIPSRLYRHEPAAGWEASLTPPQKVIARCLYSRHSDGYVRQRHIEQVLESSEPWVAPFVVQLAGEYVLEILEAIGHGLPGLAVPGSVQRKLYGEFVARNPAFFVRTERRAVNYWACHYRWKYAAFGTYPGPALLEAFRTAASEHTGTRWPRNTPPPV